MNGDPFWGEVDDIAPEPVRKAADREAGMSEAIEITMPDGPVRDGTVTYYDNLIQGSDEWLAARCGLLTASEMKLIITPTLKMASNDKERAHLYELAAQRITKYVEPRYISDDMLRGQQDEIDARVLYAQHYGHIEEVGFITNDRWGFTIGYSPDGIVGESGLIECKSRRQRFQFETWTECVTSGAPPSDYIIQIQTGMLVSERAWCDFVSFSGGMPMVVIRVYADDKIQSTIIEAASEFEKRLAAKVAKYHAALASVARLIPTERRVEQEIII